MSERRKRGESERRKRDAAAVDSILLFGSPLSLSFQYTSPSAKSVPDTCKTHASGPSEECSLKERKRKMN